MAAREKCLAVPAFGLCVGLCVLCAAVDTLFGSDGKPPSTLDVQVWIQELEGPTFQGRSKATRQLEELGLRGLPVVDALLGEGSLEARWRVLSILRVWSRAKNESLQREAVKRLDALASTPQHRLASEASRILTWRRHQIHQETVAFFERLGGNVTVRETGDRYWTTVQISSGWRGNDEDLVRLRDLEGLSWLSLERSSVGDRGLEMIGACEQLKYLMLGGSRVTIEGLGYVRMLPQLEHLSLQDLPVDGAALAALRPMPQLLALGLDRTRVSNSDLVYLQGFPNLKRLWLDGTQVTDQGLAHLTHLQGLTHLYLAGTHTGGEGLKHLAALPTLQHLSLKEVKFHAEGIRQLGKLRSLVSLGLDHTNVTDEMIAELTGLDNLQVLWLSRAPVTDACLAHLKKLPALRTVYAHGSQITKEGAEEFMRQTGDRCRVHF